MRARDADRLLPASEVRAAARVDARIPDSARSAAGARGVAVARRLLPSRCTTLVKDEALFDRYDLAFGTYFKGVNAIFDIRAELPEEWLKKEFERHLTPEEKAMVEALGGFAKLSGRPFASASRSRRSATPAVRSGSAPAARAPSAHTADNPEGIRIGQAGSGNRSAGQGRGRAQLPQPRRRRRAQHAQHQGRAPEAPPVRARRRARGSSTWTGAPSKARRATPATSDLHLVPERRNRVKVLLFLDVGGSMDPHVRLCEELFSAAKSEFRHLETFYFHNCVYDHVWARQRAPALRSHRHVGPAAQAGRRTGSSSSSATPR